MLDQYRLLVGTYLLVQDSSLSYVDTIAGAALFDLSGLPQEYFVTSESSDLAWVQTVFQAVGLQSLLVSSLQLQGFRHTIVYGAECCIVIVRQKAGYVALLLQPTYPGHISEAFLKWSQDLELSVLRSNPRFNPV